MTPKKLAQWAIPEEIKANLSCHIWNNKDQLHLHLLWQKIITEVLKFPHTKTTTGQKSYFFEVQGLSEKVLYH